MIEEQACKKAIFKDLFTQQNRATNVERGGGQLVRAKFLIVKLEMGCKISFIGL